jgi:hypothetical protein
MRCPECERTGQRSKLYMPTGYFSTAMGGTETFYDEDGHLHHHEVNSSRGRGHEAKARMKARYAPDPSALRRTP